MRLLLLECFGKSSGYQKRKLGLGGSFVWRRDFFLSSSRKYHLLFTGAGTMSGRCVGGEESCRKEQANLLFLAGAATTGGHAFPLAWEHSKFLLKEVSGKFPI